MVKRVIFAIVAAAGLAALVVSPVFARAPRVVDDNDTVVLHGNVHPLARPEFDAGATDLSLPMERMVLTVRVDPGKEAELDRLLAEQQDPASANFHRWLTPEEFGKRFGPAPEDIGAITGWLTSQGFVVEEVANSRTWINFSGKAADVERAFHTRMRDYHVGGQLRHANASDPEIPRGLVDLVAGVVSLHNFPRKAMNSGIRPLAPQDVEPAYTTAGGHHYLSPGDFAIIYNVNSLYSSGIDGTGQNIAIVGRTHPSSTNWADFRSKMGLPANAPQVILNGADPGDLGASEDGEADLDIEWSGAVAKNATIKFVVSKSTTTDGVDLSAQYIVNNNLAPVMSTSFGQCESAMGAAENLFYNNLWKQAASQGITSFVASGDSGVDGCSSANATSGTGLAVNGLASTPYNIAVGGTEFNEGSGSYWNSSNGTGDTSAISYVPETAWNESGSVSGGSGLWATGGGASAVYGKPSWQVSPGVPADGKRDVPDVSLTAAGHDAYLVESQGTLQAIAGTSASSPSFAGLMALVVQKTGQRQGNAAARFYQLGNSQYGTGSVTVFHDITTGNNSVPGVSGYSSTTGYDQATGLGSVDATALVNNWISDFTIAAAQAPLSAAQGASVATTITMAVSGGFNGSVSLSASGLPAGATADFNPASIAAPGSGSSTLTLTAGPQTPAGTYNVTITGTSGGTIHTSTISFTVIALYSLTTDITGSGAINNIQQNSPAFTCTSPNTSCTSTFDAGTSFTLHATPSALYDFTGWSGGGCGTGDCQLTLNNNTTVTATFTPQPLAQLVGSVTPYLSLSDAYGNASNGSELKLRDVILSGDSHLNKAIDVTIKGGYAADFTTVDGYTTLQGIFSLEQGSAIVNNLIIR